MSRPLAVALVLLVGCAVNAAVASAQPLPKVVPARPLPPLGAVATMSIPPRDATGVRQTVNARLTPAQTTWNLRSALNVAALNCLAPRHQPILGAYKALLKTHAKALAANDRAIDEEFRERHGASYLAARDTRMTRVYNYFALPPVLPAFCDAALRVATEAPLVASGELDGFAGRALPRLEQLFERFFREFEQYRVAAAAWDVRYGSAAGR